MPNPFDFIHELRGFNDDLDQRLTLIEEKLDMLLILYRANAPVDWYGDGR